MELTDFEKENLRDAINVRLTDILNDLAQALDSVRKENGCVSSA